MPISILRRFAMFLLLIGSLLTACKKEERPKDFEHPYPEILYFRVYYADAATGTDLIGNRIPDTILVEKRSRDTFQNYIRQVYSVADTTGKSFFQLQAGYSGMPPCYIATYVPPPANFRDTFIFHLGTVGTDSLIVEQNEHWPNTLFDYRKHKVYTFPAIETAYGKARLQIPH